MTLLSARTCRSSIALAVVVVVVASGAFLGIGLSPAGAEVTTVTGSAFNYSTDVSLSGEPADVRGHRQPEGAPHTAASPAAGCPDGGGVDSATAAEGARAEHGTEVLFGGLSAEDGSTAPPSGPLASEVECEEDLVSASTSVTLTADGTDQPGGVVSGPFAADEVHSSCTATANGFVTDVTIVNGLLEVSHDDTRQPTQIELVLENPEPNSVREGTIDHLGDRYRVTFNQQSQDADGSVTVSAVHLELLGPTAVGEIVIGQATCGVTTTAAPQSAAPQSAAPQSAAPQSAARDAAPQDASTPAPEAAAAPPSRDRRQAPTATASSADPSSAGPTAAGPRAVASTDTTERSGTMRAAQDNPFQVAQASGEVGGEAYNYYTDVGLFGGPSEVRGHGQADDAPATAASPSVECTGDGSDSASQPEGARAQYGPAVLFGGIWPEDATSAPASGPLTSEIDCEGGTMTASTSVTLRADGSGGIGPGPVVAEEAHSSCTANADGVTGEVRFVGGVLETQYDETTQEPSETEPIPENPSPNTVREGTIDHVGDSYRVTFNRQVENANGSLTVDAVYMELLGPTAVGEMVIGSVTCGTGTATGAPGTGNGTTDGNGATDRSGATDGTGATDQTGATDRGSGSGARDGQLARTGSDPLPAAALGLGLLLAGILMLRSAPLGRAAGPARR